MGTSRERYYSVPCFARTFAATVLLYPDATTCPLGRPALKQGRRPSLHITLRGLFGLIDICVGFLRASGWLQSTNCKAIKIALPTLAVVDGAGTAAGCPAIHTACVDAPAAPTMATDKGDDDVVARYTHSPTRL